MSRPRGNLIFQVIIKTILESMQIKLAGWIAVHFLNGSKNLNKKQEPLKRYVDLFGPLFSLFR